VSAPHASRFVLPGLVQRLFLAFEATHAAADVWRRWPDVTPEEQDTPDCVPVSAMFLEHAQASGFHGSIVLAAAAEHPWAETHAWVRLYGVLGMGGWLDIDWTARQYHNLEQLDGFREAVLALPWPLTWPGSDVHPIAGSFRTVHTVMSEGDARAWIAASPAWA